MFLTLIEARIVVLFFLDVIILKLVVADREIIDRRGIVREGIETSITFHDRVSIPQMINDSLYCKFSALQLLTHSFHTDLT